MKKMIAVAAVSLSFGVGSAMAQDVTIIGPSLVGTLNGGSARIENNAIGNTSIATVGKGAIQLVNPGSSSNRHKNADIKIIDSVVVAVNWGRDRVENSALGSNAVATVGIGSIQVVKPNNFFGG